MKANGGAPGVDGMDIEKTTEHLRQHWEKIEAKLRAGFNRRMRKTACPVVWKGRGVPYP